jgi:hypothetical protein
VKSRPTLKLGYLLAELKQLSKEVKKVVLIDAQISELEVKALRSH